MALIAFIISAVVAYFLADAISGVLESMFGLKTAIETAIANQITGMDAVLGEVPKATIEELVALVNGANVDAFMKTIMVNYLNSITITGLTTVSALVSVYLADAAMLAISFVVIFVAVRALLGIVMLFLKHAMEQSTSLSVVDKIFGGVVGLAKSILWVVVIAALAVVMAKLPVVGDVVNSGLQETAIAKWIFDIVNGMFGF